MKANYTSDLPKEPGYYWTRDECGRTTIAFVFEELVWSNEKQANVSNGWKATMARGGLTLPLETLTHRRWSGPIEEPA